MWFSNSFGSWSVMGFIQCKKWAVAQNRLKNTDLSTYPFHCPKRARRQRKFSRLYNLLLSVQVLCAGCRVGTAALLRQRAGEEPETPRVAAPVWRLGDSQRRGAAHVHRKLCQWWAVQAQRWEPRSNTQSGAAGVYVMDSRACRC